MILQRLFTFLSPRLQPCGREGQGEGERNSFGGLGPALEDLASDPPL
jgi:hypothetical protein